jgi:CHAD domain-containing protein
VKPRRVKGVDGDRPVSENARRILRVRLDELYSFDEQVRDPWQSVALHDCRIAAKRVRYVLEILGPTLGDPSEELHDRAKEIQDILGELHDCDVLVPRLERLQIELRAQDALAISQRAEADPDNVIRVTPGAPNADAHRGIAVLEAAVTARRALLHRQFIERWEELLVFDVTALVGELQRRI